MRFCLYVQVSFAIAQAAEEAAAPQKPASKKRARPAGDCYALPFLLSLSHCRLMTKTAVCPVSALEAAAVQHHFGFGPSLLQKWFFVVQIPGEPTKGLFLEKPSPLSFAKAIKNEAELDGMREAHLRDAVALAETLHHLEKEVCFQFISAKEGGM